MNDNLSSMITPKNLVKDNLSRVMPLRSKGVVMVDHFIRARWKIMKFDFFIYNVSLLAASQTVNFASSVEGLSILLAHMLWERIPQVNYNSYMVLQVISCYLIYFSFERVKLIVIIC